MRFKSSIKILIDKRKLDILLRLNCPKEIIIDLIFENKLTLTGDSLIDEHLESLIDIKEFENWGGSRKGSGRPKKNHLENQDENHLENQDINQVGDKDIDKDKDIDIDITLNKQIDTIINSENKNFLKNSDPFINPQIDKIFKMYSEYCKNLLSLNGYKSKKLRESLLEFLKDVNYDFEYIKNVFVKANELKTIIDQPIDLQKIINCHERIANDYYKKLKQQPQKQPYQQEQPRKLTPEEELALYNDPNTYRPF